MERTHHFSKKKNDFDVFPSSWFLIFPHYTSDQVQIKTIFGDLKIQAQSAIFVPPLKMIRWILFPGHIKWYAYRGEAILPVDLRSEAFIFKFNEVPMFDTTNQIYEFIRKNKEPSISLPAEMTASKLARQIKECLDNDFDALESSKLTQLAIRLKVKPNEVSQAFKRCYGVTPVDYKNRLKLNKALYKMWFEKDNNITDICYEAGFEEYSVFYRNFLRWLNVEPSYIATHSEEILSF